MFDNFCESFLNKFDTNYPDVKSTEFVDYLTSRFLNSETLSLLSSAQQHEVIQSFKTWRAEN
jgi:hypothetical protein